MRATVSWLHRFLPWGVVVSILVVALVAATRGLIEAQTSDAGWSPPMVLFEAPGTIRGPRAVGDASGAVHIVWWVESSAEYGESTSGNAIYYARCCQPSPSEGTDIAAGSSVSSPVIAVDASGRPQLIFHDTPNLYHQLATSAEAKSARDWEGAVAIDEAWYHADIVTDKHGELYTGYARPRAGGIYCASSSDGGRSWTQASSIASTQAPNAAADWIQLAIADDGTLHAVWTEFPMPIGYPPLGVYYARSEDHGRTWSAPYQLAGDGYTQITIAATDPQHLHVAYNGRSGVGGHYHRWSGDGGRTWSEPITIVPSNQGGGQSGLPSLVVDSARRVHFLSGDGPWYAVWDGNQWSKPERVVVRQPDEKVQPRIEESVMTITEGNKLHVVYYEDGKRLLYRTKQLDAPAIAPMAYPTVEVTPTPSATSTSVPKVTATPRLLAQDWNAGDRDALAVSTGNQHLGTVAGSILTMLFIMSVIAVRVWLLRRM